MCRKGDVLEAAERRARIERFFREDIQRRVPQRAIGEGGQQRRIVYYTATRGIHQNRSRLN